MEPGRCVFLSLIAVGYSSLEGNILSQQICFKRKDDLLLNNQHNNVTTIARLSNNRFEEVSHVKGDIVISITGQIIGVSIGSLSDSDLQAEYGTASSFEFRSYVINPNNTKWASTREIRKRIVKPLAVNYFIAPTPTMDVEFIDVYIKINLNDFDNLTVPALLIWDSYTFNSDTRMYGIWRHVEENCGRDIKTPTMEGNIYKTKICQKTFQMSRRGKRSTAVTVSNPYQFTLTVMNVSFYNSAPEVAIDTIVTMEDTPIIDFQIPYHDDEMDFVQFYLLKNSDFGFANLTLNGSLTYYPKSDFSGKDSIKITLTDNAKYPATFVKTIWIEVSEVNDMPMFGFLYNDSSYDVMEKKSLNLLFEGNSTFHYLFDFGFADVDGNETLSFISSLTNTKDVNITTMGTDTAWFLNDTFGQKKMRTLQGYSANMVINKTFHGDFYYYILGYDSHSYFTERLETHIFILLFPCIHGFCSPKFNTSPPCQDSSRATSFDFYKCTCHPGYTGMWCENEINECLQQPCGELYNCKDKINSYECVIKPVSLACLIVAAILFIILVAIFYRIFMSKTKTYRVTIPLPQDQDESFDDLIECKNLQPITTDCKSQQTGNKLPQYGSFVTSQGTSRKEPSLSLSGSSDSQDYYKNIEADVSRSTTHTDPLKQTYKHRSNKENPFFAKIWQKFEKKKPMKRVPFWDPIEHENAAYASDIPESDFSNEEQFESNNSVQDDMAKVRVSEKSHSIAKAEEKFCFQNSAYSETSETSNPEVEIQRDINFRKSDVNDDNDSLSMKTSLHGMDHEESPVVPKSIGLNETHLLETAKNASINHGQNTERHQLYDETSSSKLTEPTPCSTKDLAAAKNYFTTSSPTEPTIICVASSEECPPTQMSDTDEETDRNMTSTPIGTSIEDVLITENM